MNAVEIEEAVSKLAEAPFDAETFPYAFLEAFGNKETTLKRLKTGSTNQSDLRNETWPGVLQRNNIHIKVCPEGEVTATLAALRNSPATARQKAKFILATDGKTFEAEDITSGETVACPYAEFSDHFGFFLPLAGITTVKQIRENAFDIKATSRLNRLYVELLKNNPDWDTEARREDLNHFFARLIFCFFAEDTHIFQDLRQFTETIERMTAPDGSNTHEVLSELFRAMNIPRGDRAATDLRPWALRFPYVNGNLFAGSSETPRFTRTARSYLIHVGNLNWKLINPDIFGSMIQAVADDEERGALGMHYTSVPNILKVLNPLFLDDLRAKLEEAGDSPQKLLNLRKRLARIRVFDPACGSGNFLVIAYKEMRKIEAEINRRRGEPDRLSDIPLTNFRGIEIRHFAAEIARLALVIAKFQCDAIYRGELLARSEFLPLEKANWITCGNALRLDWLKICPPTGTGVKVRGDDLFNTPLDQAEIDFENHGGETYICGNPPYKGSQSQDDDQKEELEETFAGLDINWRGLDYVAGWFRKASLYAKREPASFAFVSTNSLCQGKAVSSLWPDLLGADLEIQFAYTSFRWANLASHNAGVTVIVVGVGKKSSDRKRLFVTSLASETTTRDVTHINAYLVPAPEIYVEPRTQNLSGLQEMAFGNMPIDGGSLNFTYEEVHSLGLEQATRDRFIRKIFGGAEHVRGLIRYCLWLNDETVEDAKAIPVFKERLDAVAKFRKASKRAATRDLAGEPHRFGWIAQRGTESLILLPRILSERREYITVGHEPAGTLTTDQAYALYDAPLWNLGLIASRLHLVWIATVCGRLKTDYRYSNTLGWNTFPVPALSDQNKADLTRTAEDILLAREAHFPATIADLYDPEKMPANLREAHDRNDETLERIYIGRRFKNDTERLEKLFEMYTQMTATQETTNKTKRQSTKKTKKTN